VSTHYKLLELRSKWQTLCMKTYILLFGLVEGKWEKHVFKCKKRTSDLMQNTCTTAFDIKKLNKEIGSAIFVTLCVLLMWSYVKYKTICCNPPRSDCRTVPKNFLFCNCNSVVWRTSKSNFVYCHKKSRFSFFRILSKFKKFSVASCVSFV
jgi:hypothetical protein